MPAIRPEVLELMPTPTPLTAREVAARFRLGNARAFGEWLAKQPVPLFYKGARGARMMTRQHVSKALDVRLGVEPEMTVEVSPDAHQLVAGVEVVEASTSQILGLGPISERRMQLYVASSKHAVKIGISKTPGQRIASLARHRIANGSIERAWVFCAEDAASTLEGLLHRQFADERIEGEWFAVSAESVLMEIMSLTGLPIRLSEGVL